MMTSFERYTKKTRRAAFLEEMEQVVPWAELCALIEPYYPKAGNGRQPVGLGRMLRIYFLQQWFNLSDPAVEEALYDSAVMRQFVGIDLGQEPVPDETTACKFRHLLEEQGLGGEILQAVNLYLQRQGVKIATGTIVDATILHAPQFDQEPRAEAGSCDAPDEEGQAVVLRDDTISDPGMVGVPIISGISDRSSKTIGSSPDGRPTVQQLARDQEIFQPRSCPG